MYTQDLKQAFATPAEFFEWVKSKGANVSALSYLHDVIDEHFNDVNFEAIPAKDIHILGIIYDNYVNVEDKLLETYRVRQNGGWRHGKFDAGGRWYPDDMLECCYGVRSPSRRFPFSLLRHCATIKHIANEYGVEPAYLRMLIRQAYGKDSLKQEAFELYSGSNMNGGVR
jgi:hypothetical protein